MALREGAADVPSAYPERAFAQPAAEMTTARATAGVLIGATALMLAVSLARPRRSESLVGDGTERRRDRTAAPLLSLWPAG
jgi:hypothetical protein